MKRRAACFLTLCFLAVAARPLHAQDGAGTVLLNAGWDYNTSGATLTLANSTSTTTDNSYLLSGGTLQLTGGATITGPGGGAVPWNNGLGLTFAPSGFNAFPGNPAAGNSLGALHGSFLCKASKVLADPLRARVYIADTAGKQIIVVDTATLQVVGKVETSAPPADMAISLDNGTLYVYGNNAMYSGTVVVTTSLSSTNPINPTTKIDAIDLETLNWRNTLTVSGRVAGIATGVGGQLYLAVAANSGLSHTGAMFAVLDANTGEVMSSCPLSVLPTGSMFLDAASGKVRASCASGFLAVDVSGEDPVSMPLRSNTSARTGPMVASHDGGSLYWANGGPINWSTGTQDYSSSSGSLYLYNTSYSATAGAYAQPLACSADNTRLYQVNPSTRTLQVLKAKGYGVVQEHALPFGNGILSMQIPSMTTDSSGRYLFVSVIGTTSQSSSVSSSASNGAVYVLDTGEDAPLPDEVNMVNVTAVKPNIVAGGGRRAAFTLTRTMTSDVADPLTVAYTVRGTAVGDADYVALRGTKTFPAGCPSVTIPLTPAEDIGPAAKTVTLRVQPSESYLQGGSTHATVTIRPGY